MATQLKPPAGRTYQSDNITPLARLDIPGAGQVTIDGDYAYVGYMYGPEGTSILDIADPRKPKVIWTTSLEDKQAHSHKVRVVGDVMVTNLEQRPQHGVRATKDFADPGVRLWNIRDKANPKLINYHRTGGRGVHRFDMDEKYLYLSTEMEGFLGHILMIYDYTNPEKLEEVSRWWIPGQHTAGGETPGPMKREHRLHHALRFGDKLYAGLWMSGFCIIDIADIRHPKTLGSYDPHPTAKEPSHTLLRFPFKIDGRDIALGTDEERGSRGKDVGQPHGPLYVFDITDPNTMKLLSTCHVPEDGMPYTGDGVRFGAHQFREKFDDTLTYVTWFAAGLRIFDIKKPEAPEEVGYFIPEPGTGYNAPQTNDVEIDTRGFIHITDKARGYDVIEFRR
ncbi:MAG: RNA polymerase subunit sigma-70 [Alphaproteobacteria bacterium]|nr:RNA polymerase subunit sigma-70 [Alphaproteobacteria bacterium]